jgi:hypothetical protein
LHTCCLIQPRGGGRKRSTGDSLASDCCENGEMCGGLYTCLLVPCPGVEGRRKEKEKHMRRPCTLDCCENRNVYGGGVRTCYPFLYSCTHFLCARPRIEVCHRATPQLPYAPVGAAILLTPPKKKQIFLLIDASRGPNHSPFVANRLWGRDPSSMLPLETPRARAGTVPVKVRPFLRRRGMTSRREKVYLYSIDFNEVWGGGSKLEMETCKPSYSPKD